MHLPPLRERKGDILLLAKHFLSIYSHEENKAFKGFDESVKRIFNEYAWPGNVRQLQNIIRNIVVLNSVDTVKEDHLPAPFNQAQSDVQAVLNVHTIKASAPFHEALEPQDVRPLSVVEREAIEQAIAACHGNIPKAAALLDVSPSTIYRKKQAWD